MNKRVATGLTAGVVLVAVAWVVVPQVYDWWYTPRHRGPVVDLTMVTRAEYERVQTGMSYSETCKVIESAGTERSSSRLGEISTVMYQWVNPDGSNRCAPYNIAGSPRRVGPLCCARRDWEEAVVFV
jgi:hypothetical protein